MIRARVDLPQPELADHREGLAAVHLQVDALQRPDGARPAEQAAAGVVAGNAAGFEDGAHSVASVRGAMAVTVGSRPPWAFSGNAERSARV